MTPPTWVVVSGIALALVLGALLASAVWWRRVAALHARIHEAVDAPPGVKVGVWPEPPKRPDVLAFPSAPPVEHVGSFALRVIADDLERLGVEDSAQLLRLLANATVTTGEVHKASRAFIEARQRREVG